MYLLKTVTHNHRKRHSERKGVDLPQVDGVHRKLALRKSRKADENVLRIIREGDQQVASDHQRLLISNLVPKPGLLEAWLVLTSVKYHGNLYILIPLNQRLALTRLRATGPREVVHSGRDITSCVSMAACQCLDAFPLTLVKMSGSVSLTIHPQQNTFETSLCDLVSFMFIGLRYP